MTTKVTVEVPEDVDYIVAVKTGHPGTRGHKIDYLKPGEKRDWHIHNALRIVGIEELPKEGV